MSTHLAGLLPIHVSLPAAGLLTATLGRAETEAVATLIVLWHHKNSPTVWAPMLSRDFRTSFRGDTYFERIARNPFWARAFLHGFEAIVTEGFVDGWVVDDFESVGTVTPKFVEAISGSAWDARTRSSLVPSPLVGAT